MAQRDRHGVCLGDGHPARPWAPGSSGGCRHGPEVWPGTLAGAQFWVSLLVGTLTALAPATSPESDQSLGSQPRGKPRPEAGRGRMRSRPADRAPVQAPDAPPPCPAESRDAHGDQPSADEMRGGTSLSVGACHPAASGGAMSAQTHPEQKPGDPQEAERPAWPRASAPGPQRGGSRSGCTCGHPPPLGLRDMPAAAPDHAPHAARGHGPCSLGAPARPRGPRLPPSPRRPRHPRRAEGTPPAGATCCCLWAGTACAVFPRQPPACPRAKAPAARLPH